MMLYLFGNPMDFRIFKVCLGLLAAFTYFSGNGSTERAAAILRIAKRYTQRA